MTTTAPEAVQGDPGAAEEPLPAALAIAGAVAAAQATQRRRAGVIVAYGHGNIGHGRHARILLVDQLVRLVLASLWSSVVTGARYGAEEWRTMPNPAPLSRDTQRRIQDALWTVLDEETATDPDLTDPDQRYEFRDQVIMRVDRLTLAESITAARTAYAVEVDAAIGDDADRFEWVYLTDADPCHRCIALALQTFQTYADAPAGGAHPGCQCVLIAQLKGIPDDRIDD